MTSSTVSVKVVVADIGGLPSSVAVTVTECSAGASASPGVPENVRVAALKASQPGSAPPSASVAA